MRECEKKRGCADSNPLRFILECVFPLQNGIATNPFETSFLLEIFWRIPRCVPDVSGKELRLN